MGVCRLTECPRDVERDGGVTRRVWFLHGVPVWVAVPQASNLNHRPGDVVPNAVFAKVGAGAMCAYTLATDIVIDVNAADRARSPRRGPGGRELKLLIPPSDSVASRTCGYDASVGVTVVGAAKAPDGDTVIAVEPAHTKWGCCLGERGCVELGSHHPRRTTAYTFGTGGVVPPEATAKPGTVGSFTPVGVGVDGSGRTVLAGRLPLIGGGSANTVLRRTTTGAADSTFGANGRVDLPAPTVCGTQYTEPTISDVLVQPDAKVVWSGRAPPSRVSSSWPGPVMMSGALDPAFDNDGMMTKVLPESVGACCNVNVHRITGGKLVIGTASNVAAILRLDADGGMDMTYSGDGMALVGNERRRRG